MLLTDFVGEVQKLMDENDRLKRQLGSKKHNNTKKLTPREVKDIRRLYATSGMYQRHLAEAFDVNPATISRIVRGQYHRAVA